MNEFHRILNATKFSYNALKVAIKEPAFRTEILILPFIIWGAISLAGSNIEMLLMIGCWIVVLIVETINTSIEATIDRIGTEHHELSGLAKDLGSLAVAIATILAIFTWVMILFF